MAKKPLLFAEDHDEPERFDPEYWEGRTRDPSWIPGYSEIVQANDVDQVDDLDFRNAMRDNAKGITSKEDVYALIGAKPQELPVEFAWLPISDPAGRNSQDIDRRLDEYTNRRGFRLATREDLERHGYGTTRTMHEAEDGSIRRGPDTALYVRSREVARKWKRWKRKEALEQDGAPLPEQFRNSGHVAPTFENPEQRERAEYAH